MNALYREGVAGTPQASDQENLATMIAQSVLASIAGHRGAGGWHDLPVKSVVSAVELELSGFTRMPSSPPTIS
jgi:hypothetical protein